MPLKWSQIETWDSDQLHRYADVIGERQKTVEHQAKLIWVQFRNFYGSGKSADALREKMLIAHEELTVLADDLAEIWETIKLVAGDISQVQSAVQLARARAKSLNLEIAPDSTVNPGSSGVSINVYPSTDLRDVERLVARAIELAVEADDALARRLSSVGIPGSVATSKTTAIHYLSEAEQEEFKRMTPVQRAKYWAGQSETQKRHLCDTYPELIGNADGVEAWARDRANRLMLPELIRRAKNRMKYVEEYLQRPETQLELPEQLQNDPSLMEYRDNLEREIQALEVVQEYLNNGLSYEEYQTGRSGKLLSLLTLQTDGERVKAAIGLGDVDHAQHVATFVPGIGTTVEESLEKYARFTENLRETAAQEANLNEKEIATITWLGYDAPGKVALENLPGIMTRTLADRGAERLTSFVDGLQASRAYNAGDAHSTLLAHSYGSVVSGIAATKTTYGAIDDLVLFGSPGMGTYDPADFKVPEGRRWVSAIPQGDSVQGMGWYKGVLIGGFGKNPSAWDSTFIHLSGDATADKNYNYDASPSDHLQALLKISSPFDFSNHNSYMEPETETLRDFARVVVGTKKQ